MPVVRFTKALERHIACPPDEVEGTTVREALDAYLARHPAVRGYVLDEQGALRKHMAVFVDGAQIVDRLGMSDPVGPGSEMDVLQALSGG
jgi:molybdopterin synthase sulfur carrier subunit